MDRLRDRLLHGAHQLGYCHHEWANYPDRQFHSDSYIHDNQSANSNGY